MCILCVEIARERITVRDGLKGMREAIADHNSSSESAHLLEIITADEDGDVQKIKELIIKGYKAERWL